MSERPKMFLVIYEDPHGAPRAYATGDSLEDVQDAARRQLKAYCADPVREYRNVRDYARQDYRHNGSEYVHIGSRHTFRASAPKPRRRVITLIDGDDGERYVILDTLAEPDASLAQFLLDNVDAPDVWDAVREILSGDEDGSSSGGGAAPTTRYYNATAPQARRLLKRQNAEHRCEPNPIECPACHGDGTGND